MVVHRLHAVTAILVLAACCLSFAPSRLLGQTGSKLSSSNSRQLGRTVFDKTGLTGLYDHTLQWNPDDKLGPNGVALQDPGSTPDLFTALQEQLGLKIEPQKGPVDVVIIDHVNRQPLEN